MQKNLGLMAMFALGLSVFGGVYWLSSGSTPRVSQTAAFSVPGQMSMTVDAAHQAFFQVTPALLLVIYEAFGKTDETDIYDTLATVTHGEALEYLYLERIGAMAGGGLDEADQTIHEINLVNADVTRDAATLEVAASWQVIGTVGHAEHLHVRGNTYKADFKIAPVEGAWRITEFELLEVDRDAAGETFLAPEDN